VSTPPNADEPGEGPEPLDPGVRILSETALTDRVHRDRPVMVVFYADWCPFSEASMPTIRQTADDVDMEVVAANISHPKDPRWGEFDIETVPTLAVFENGTELRRAAARRGQSLEEDDMLALAEKASAEHEDTPEEDLDTAEGGLEGP
jgi:thiol-disulfide isomerase/thioredoxin